jgi:hypothetical protein
VDALEHLALRGGVEIDHHVAAEDDVEGLAQHVPGAADEVEGPELDRPRQFRPHPDLSGVGAGAAQEVAPQPLRVQPAAVGRVDAAARGVEHARVDVGGQQPQRRGRPHRLDRRHRERIRLLAGRRRVAPQAQRPPLARPQLLRQRVEVVLLAEEGRQVGRQAVHERLPLAIALGAAALLERLQVVAEASVAGLAQPARQPAVDHGLLAGVQADAGTRVDQRAHALEVGRRHRRLGVGKGRRRQGGRWHRRGAGGRCWEAGVASGGSGHRVVRRDIGRRRRKRRPAGSPRGANWPPMAAQIGPRRVRARC